MERFLGRFAIDRQCSEARDRAKYRFLGPCRHRLTLRPNQFSRPGPASLHLHSRSISDSVRGSVAPLMIVLSGDRVSATIPVSTGLAPAQLRFPLGLSQWDHNWSATEQRRFPLGLSQRNSGFHWACPSGTTTGPLWNNSGFHWACPSATPVSTGLVPVGPQLVRYRTTPVSTGLVPVGPQLVRYPNNAGFRWACPSATPVSTGLVPVGLQLVRYRTTPVSAGLAPVQLRFPLGLSRVGPQLVRYRTTPVSAGLAPVGPQLVRYKAAQMQPIYTHENTVAAFQLNWSVSLFGKVAFPPLSSWLDQLKSDTEQDGVRILEARLDQPHVGQFFVSTRPDVALPRSSDP